MILLPLQPFPAIPPSPARPRHPVMIRVQQAMIRWRCHAAGNTPHPACQGAKADGTLQGTSTCECRPRLASHRLRCRRRPRVYGYGGSGRDGGVAAARLGFHWLCAPLRRPRAGLQSRLDLLVQGETNSCDCCRRASTNAVVFSTLS